ncbi:activator of HSP90 ATPase [Dictyobacter alpinus]|uniref:Activator of HSP90 ATPase n=1 Tax=Dictyobacter alpinus TaxID=2014873 RepID=A0A402B1H2_9CHLR|nr:SRPBCC family protein [Dictyobacter alpinus]GCE25188.1 activator of HSP90 ATPase [Dictyobacter alpinus]
MSNLQLTQMPVAETAMLIRRPVAEVFRAFIDPAITSKFWFTRGSGNLEQGRRVQWDWEMYDLSIQVTVLAIEEQKRILIEWPGYGTSNLVEWIFTARKDNTTFVRITNTGFSGNGEGVKQAIDATQGFTFLLAGLKAFLEHNVILHLIADGHPKEPEEY